MTKKTTQRKADPAPEAAPEAPPEITRDPDFDYSEYFGETWMSRKGNERSPGEHVAFAAFGRVYTKAIEVFISGTEEEVAQSEAELEHVSPRFLRRILRNARTGEPPTPEECVKLLEAGAAERVAKLAKERGSDGPEADPTDEQNS